MHDASQDKSGYISTDELLAVLRAIGQNPTEDELNTLIMEVDIDGNGNIDFQEFVDMMRKKTTDIDIEADIRDAFRIFDRNKVKMSTDPDLRSTFGHLKSFKILG